MFLRQLINHLLSEKINFAVVGGFALALHGIVRATMDVDIVVNINETDLSRVEQALQKFGLRSRLPIRAKEVAHFRQEYIKKRNLIAWSFVDFNNPSRQVDVLINIGLQEIKTVSIKAFGMAIPVVSLENLLEMKLSAGRPQDLADAKKIRERLGHG